VVHFWEPRGAVLKPYLFDATVAPHAMRIELAPTMHGAILRVSFPADLIGKFICFAGAHVRCKRKRPNHTYINRYCLLQWTGNGMTPMPHISGKSTEVHQDRMLVSNFNHYIHAESEAASSVEVDGDMNCFRYKYVAYRQRKPLCYLLSCAEMTLQ
jgi:hypothetical protein